MDSVNTNNGESSSFNHVQEKIKPKSKKRIKKVLITLGTTLAAALIFGFFARLMFEVSGTPVAKMLGINNASSAESDSGTRRNEVTLSKDTVTPRPQNVRPSQSDLPASIGQDVSEGHAGVSGGTGQSNNGTMGDSDVPAVTSQPGELQESADAGTDSETQERVQVEIGSSVHSETQSGQDTSDLGGGESAVPTVSTTEPEKTPVPTENAASATPVPVPTEPQTTGVEGAGEDSGNSAAGNTDNESDSEGQDSLPEENSADAQSPLAVYIQMMTELRSVAKAAANGMVRVYAITSGVNWMDESIETRQELTGIALAENGVELLILTDYAAVWGADRIEIEFSNKSIAEGYKYSADEDIGLAVVAVPLEGISETAEYDFMLLADEGEELEEGCPIIAMGSPNGYYGAVEFGFVSHHGLKGYFTDGSLELFTTDINVVQNGDALIIDLTGRLLGVVPFSAASKAAEGSKNSVILISSIKEAMIKLLNSNSMPYFGIHAEDMPEYVLAGMGLENGIYVNEAIANSPAAEAGVKKGDILTSINGITIDSMKTFYSLLLSLEIGGEAEVEIFRSSRKEEPQETLKVVISEK